MTNSDDIGSLIKLNEYCVITFASTSGALKGERLMKADRRFVIMPTPGSCHELRPVSKSQAEDVRESTGYCGGRVRVGRLSLSRDGDKRMWYRFIWIRA